MARVPATASACTLKLTAARLLFSGVTAVSSLLEHPVASTIVDAASMVNKKCLFIM